MNSLLKSGNALLATFVAVTTLPAFALQTPAAPSEVPQSQSSPTQSAPSQATNPSAAQTPAGSPSAPAAPTASAEPMAATAAPSAPMSPVNVELVSKLDTKTAKTGDNIEARTRASAKTADGTEIPKGSRLSGHVVAVQPSNAGTNSQVVLAFDQLELKGGQSMPVHSEIESIGAAAEATPAESASAPSAGSGAPRPTPSVASPAAGGMNSAHSSSPAPTSSDSAAAPSGMPAAGTVVAKNGGIAIQTTSIPGILLANNAPGQQDPRMAKASSILLGAKRDVQLEGGTKMVVGIAATGGGR